MEQISRECQNKRFSPQLEADEKKLLPPRGERVEPRPEQHRDQPCIYTQTEMAGSPKSGDSFFSQSTNQLVSIGLLSTSLKAGGRFFSPSNINFSSVVLKKNLSSMAAEIGTNNEKVRTPPGR